MSFKFKIKSWWLTLLALIFMGFFIYLGLWQLNRAKVKQNLLAAYEMRINLPALSAQSFDLKKDLRYYRLTLTGHFDNQHTFLLDNKIFHQQLGYEVYTPFITPGLSPILIDRGFIRLEKIAILCHLFKLFKTKSPSPACSILPQPTLPGQHAGPA